MLEDRVYANGGEIGPGFAAARVEERPRERSVLFCTPDHYRVAWDINPHMRDGTGRLNEVDPPAARRQWEALTDAYARLGFEVLTLDGVEGLADMVFAANQAFPFLDRRGRVRVILSRMRAPERREEVPHYAAFLAALGYEPGRPEGLGEDSFLEGGGDLLWLPGRRLLLAGFGFRTTRDAVEALPAAVEAPVVAVRLVDPAFYHLDTALCPLSETAALVHPPAFDAEGLETLAGIFPEILVPSAQEARGFACNAHAPDGRHVILDAACEGTAELLSARGFRPIPVDTSEFRKAGGSVYCLKTMLP